MACKHRIVAVTLLLILLSAARVAAQEPTPAEQAQKIRSTVGVIVTELALATAMDAEQVDGLRRKLAEIYHQLDELAVRLESMPEPPGAAEQDEPEQEEVYNPGPWEPCANVSGKLFPSTAQFRGWSMDANLAVTLGDGGEIILRIENSYYLAEWEIYDGYHSYGQASVSATQAGEVLVNVTDANGRHEYRIESGGTGPVYTRSHVSPTGGPPEPAPEPASSQPGASVTPEDQPAGDADWYSQYLDMVRSGQLESSPAMMWFIHQAQTHSYETDALRSLGEALNRMGGGAGSEEPLGTMAYYKGEERIELPVPDPRSRTSEFISLVNRAYLLTQDGAEYSIEMN